MVSISLEACEVNEIKEGRSPLRIEKIRAGCSYAKITGPKLLQPGEEGAFDVVLNPKIVPTDAKAATAILANL